MGEKVTLPAEVVVALQTQRSELLAPLITRLEADVGSPLSNEEVIGMVRLIGDQVERIYSLNQQIDLIITQHQHLEQLQVGLHSVSDRMNDHLLQLNRLLEQSEV